MTGLFRPQALLLDFGGVLYSAIRRPDWSDRIVEEIELTLERAGSEEVPRSVITRDIGVARIAESAWKTAASRTPNPEELSGRRFFGEFVAGDWPPSARAAIAAASATLSYAFVDALSSYVVRPGIVELLTEAAHQQIPVAIVSNTRSGPAFRDFLERDRLTELISLHVFSEEVGLRKPNPEMLRLAARGLGVGIEQCWYCGDHYDRDVMCARRAGAGASVLVHDTKTLSPKYAAQAEPDLEVPTPIELAAALVEFRSHPASVKAPKPPHRDIPVERSHPNRSCPAGAARPQALLLDHGGVIVTSIKMPAWRAAFAERLARYLYRTGWKDYDAQRIADDVEEGHRLHGEKKTPIDSASVPEVSHLEFWRDLVAGDWAEHPQAAVTAHASALMFDHIRTRSNRRIRPGMLDVMIRCAKEGVPIGIVSNTLCGAVPRAFSVGFGTAPYLGVEVYSDELGVRKPDPLMIETAASALGVDPQDCWYVGDKPQRDLVCASRSGIGRAILMKRPNEPETELDAHLVVNDPFELLAALESALS